jgi:tetratricopeptide (TPR) repeat protein
MPQRVSLCVIARNEEANLRACLEPLAGVVDEIVVVDTGSTDRTKELAAELGARVFDFPWCDDFAAARNESLRHATCPWVFWMDADDRVDAVNLERLRALFAGLGEENAAYLMTCQGVADQATGAASVTEHIRLFRAHPEARWQHRVHEQILPALSRLGAELRPTDITIFHAGYLDPALKARKAERNLRILERSAAEDPNDPHALFYLGQTYLMLGALERALPLLRLCMERADARNPIAPRVYVLFTQALYQSNQAAEGLGICQAGRRQFPDNPDLLFLEGVGRQLAGEPGAAACFEALLQRPPAARSGTIDPSMYQKARHRLAIGYFKEGRHDDAEAQWTALLAETPTFTQAWLGLGDVHLARGRADVWEPFLQRAASVPGNEMGHTLLLVHNAEALRDYGGARHALEQACGRFPQALWPRLELARILAQEGRDWPAVEQALRGVLALDPNHAETRRNLAVLQQRNRPST